MIWGKTTKERCEETDEQQAKNAAAYRVCKAGERVFLYSPTKLATGRTGWLMYVWRKFIPYSREEGELERGTRRMYSLGVNPNGQWEYSEEDGNRECM